MPGFGRLKGRQNLYKSMKMKKYAVLLMLSMTALLWSSCSKDINEPVPTGGGEHVDQGNTFVVNLPKMLPLHKEML